MPYIGNIVQDFSVSTAMLNTDSVTSIKIDDGTIVNADINDSAAIAMSKLALSITNSEVNASAAIAGSKISPDFGSQNIVTTGQIKIDGDGGSKYISVGDNEDFKIYHDASGPTIFSDPLNQGLKVQAKNLNFTENTGVTTRFRINDDGHVDVTGNLDVGAGIDVTGNSTFSGDVSFGDNNITNVGTIALDTIKGDADDNTNINFAGSDIVNIKPAGTTRLSINTSGVVVTGSISATGTASTGQITAKGTQEPQIIVQDSDTSHTGNDAENGISFRDGAGTQQSMIGHNNSGDKDFYLDTAGDDHRINFRVGGSTTQLEIESTAVNVTGNIVGTGDLTIDTNTLFVDASSNRVGINTTSPDTPVHILANDAQLLTVQRDGDNNASIRFRNDTSSMFCGLTTNATGLAIDDDDNLASGPMFFVQRSNGNIGINSSSPAQTLDVNGTGIIRGNTQILGTLTATLDGNQSTQGGSGLVITHSTNTNLRANHFIVDDFPTNSGTYFIQVTESGVSNARDLCLQGYGGNVKIGNQGTAAEEKLDVEGNIKIRGGDLKISDNRGIDFSLDTENESGAGSSSGQLLDDYEEGTWTPEFDAPNQSSTTFAHNHQKGYYTKIGNLVHVTCYLQGYADTNTSGGSNDGLEITGLPFTVADLPGGGSTRHAASFAVGSRYRLLVDDLILHAFGASTNVKLWEHTSGNTMVTVKSNQATARGGTNEVYFAGSYRVHA